MAFTPNVQGSRVIGSLSGITSISSVILSASTYIGLPTDIRVTGGTYSSGIATFRNNTGGTFTVTGFSTGTSSTDTYVTGGTYSNGTATFTNNSGGTFTVSGFKTSDIFVTGSTYSNNEFIFTNNTGGTFNVLFNTVTGLTSTGLINASTISATTYQNLPIDINVTGGTYNSGSILFTNNTGGTFNVTGLYTGYTTPIDVTVTGGTYSNGTAIFTNNTGGTFNVTGFKNDDTFVTGGTYSNGDILFTNNTGGTFNVSGLYTGYTAPIDIFTTGGTFSNSTGIATFTNNSGGTFNVNGFFKTSDDIYTTGITFNPSTYDLSIGRNDNTSFTQNLAILATDMTITGGTYNGSTGIATFTNNTGGTFNVSGFLTGMTDTYTTGFTYSDNTLILKRNAGQPDLSVLIDTMTGLTVNGTISATAISATTYYNLPTDITITGGTYSNGTTTFTNNTGGTFTVSGFKTSDLVVTGGTYNSGSILFTNNTGGTFTVSGFKTDDLVVTGGTYNNGSILFTNNTGGTFNVTGLYTGYTAPIDVTVTGGTYSSGTAIFTNNTGGTFSVSGFKTDDIYTTGMTFNTSTYDLSIGRNDNTSFTQNLAILASDMTITGGTYSSSTGIATFTNNTGGTFNVSGFLTGMTDTYTTGFTYSDNTLTLKRNAGQPDLSVLINTMTGLTVTGSISATTISATTFYGNGSNLTGLVTQDTFITGSTYSNNTFTYRNNTGGTFNVLFNTVTGLTVNGNLNVTGTTTVGGTNDGLSKLYVYSTTLNTGIKGFGSSLGIYGKASSAGGTGIYGEGSGVSGIGVHGSTNSNTSLNAGVYGISIGDSNTNIGVKGYASINEGGNPTNIGGYFYTDGLGLNNYSIWLQDGTEGTNKILVSKTSDGKANWSSNLTGLTSVYVNTISATTYQNLPSLSNLYLPLSGGTVYGNTTFTNGLTANTLNVTGLTTTKGVTSTGGIIFPQKTLTSSYTATTSDYFLNVSGGTLDITLMSAVGSQGKLLVIKNEGYGIVNVLSQIGETVDDRADVLLTKGNSLQLVSDGVNWVILGYNIGSTQANTGVISFTGLSKVSSSTFYVAPVKAFIVDDVTNPVIPFLTYVEYTGGTHTTTYLNTATETWVYLTSGGTISQNNIPLTDQERRQNIFLGKLGHADKTSIINVFSQPDFVLSPLSQLRDMFDPINLINEGVRPSVNGANLSFNTSAGYLHGLGINFANDTLNPNAIYVSGNSPCTFQYRTQTGGTASNVTVIDPTKYDVGGLVTSVSGTKATNQRIYLVQNGIFRVQYGQTVYSTLAQAIAGISSEPFIEFSNFVNNGILVGILSVLSSATDLSDTSKAQFFNVSKFGDSSGAAGGAATTTLQQAYNNSSNPEIVINATLDGLTIKNGTGNADNITRLLEGQTGANGVTSFIRADGYISGTTFQSNGFIANSGGLTATTVSATTYLNLPTDIRVTGATYSNSTGVATFTNNTGGTFNVSGFFKPTDDIYTTGMTFNNGTYDLSIGRNDGTSFSQSLAILASDMTVTGGTYNGSTGVATFTNNSGGTFNVSGFLTGMTDTYTTGVTFNNNILTIQRNAGQPDINTLINNFSGLTINGTISATTISATTYQNLPADLWTQNGTSIYYNTGNVGIGESNPTRKFEVLDGTGLAYFNLTGTSGPAAVVVTTDLTKLTRFIASDGTNSINVGMRTSGETANPGFGGQNDAFIYVNTSANGLNIINAAGTGNGDYIRLYAGITANQGPSHLHVQGSGATKGFIGINTENPIARLHVSGNTLINGNLSATTISATTYQNLPPDLWTQSGTSIYYNTGKVGIGITNPTREFEVVANTETFYTDLTNVDGVAASISSTDLSKRVRFGAINSGSSVSIGQIGTTATGSTGYGSQGDSYLFSSTAANNLNIITQSGIGTEDNIKFFAGNIATATPSMIIVGSGATKGFVGIGTASPTNTLQIHGNPTASIRLQETGSGGNKRLDLSIDASAVARISANQSAQSIAFDTVNSERIRITSTGNVGIGTTVPSTKLHVSGNTLISGDLTTTTISATTYLNLPTDIRVTGGTHSSGVTTFRNNTGGTFTVSGFSTGNTTLYLYAESSTIPSVGPIVNGTNSIALGDGAQALANDMFVYGQYAGNGTTGATYSNLIGYYAGRQATGATSSNFIGTNAGYLANSSNYSNFIGTNAGQEATGATYSNLIGYYAGRQATGATSSNFIGTNAGREANSSQYSNFIGYLAGYSSTTTSYSNFYGYYAGHTASNATYSNFFGTNAGYLANSSNYSNFIGTNAGQEATDATTSNFIGYQAGQEATDATSSNFIGNAAGYLASGSSQSNFIGLESGRQSSGNTTSNFFGNRAGYFSINNVNGNFIGVNAGHSSTGATNSNFIGSQAGYISSGSTLSNFIGNNAGRETSNSIQSNFIGTSAGYGANSSQYSNFTGHLAGAFATGSSYSNFIGYYAGYNANNSNYSNFIGWVAGQGANNFTNSNFFGYAAGYLASGSSQSNFIGFETGRQSSGNTTTNFFGYRAGYFSINNPSGLFMGSTAGYGATGATSSNFIGNQAGYQSNNSTFSNFFGFQAGFSATSTSYSNFIGFQAGRDTTGTTFSNLIGYYAGETFAGNNIGSNNIVIGTNISLPNAATNSINIGGVLFGTNTYSTTTGNPSITPTSTGRIGIGIVTPSERLHVSGNTLITGNLNVSGNTNVRGLTGTSATISGTGQNILTVIGSGNSTSSPLFSVQGSSGELFSVTDSLTGSLFSVNDISGLPIVEVFSDNTMLVGSYQAPALNTTVKTILTAGTNTIYSIPTSAYTGSFIDYTVISSGATGARAGTIMSIWSGTTAQYTDVSTNDIGTTAGITFSVSVVGNNAVLSSSATTAGWTLKTIIRSI